MMLFEGYLLLPIIFTWLHTFNIYEDNTRSSIWWLENYFKMSNPGRIPPFLLYQFVISLQYIDFSGVTESKTFPLTKEVLYIVHVFSLL